MKTCYYIENECERVNYYITDDSDELRTIKKADMKLNPDDKWYECYGNIYDDELPYQEQLILFRKDFNKWVDEIKSMYNEDNYNYFDAKKYYNNHLMIKCFFSKYSSKKIKSLNIDDITKTECIYQEQCYNAGIIQLFKQGLSDCYGYDFSGYYQNIMGNKDFEVYFPIKSGKEYKYTFEEILTMYQKNKNKELKDKLPFGYYRIKIKSSHPDVLKVFTFSTNNCYTHISLIFALQYRNLYKFEFEMIDEEYNVYLYHKKSLIKSSDLFGEWFEQLSVFKKAFPKNKLIKYLGSSLWGRIIQFNRQFLTIDEVMDREDISSDINGSKPYYIKEHHNDKSIEIVNKSNMYKMPNLARIKSFLTAFTRDYVARTIIKEKIHDKIIRIHTDGLVLSEQHNFTLDYKPIPEDKTTGKIYWKSTNTYFHQCNKCNNFYKYTSNLCPDCN